MATLAGEKLSIAASMGLQNLQVIINIFFLLEFLLNTKYQNIYMQNFIARASTTCH